MSFVFIEDKGLVKLLTCPCWVVVYMWREYIAVRNLTSLSSGINIVDLDIVQVIRIISLNRLIDGGAAIFVAVHTNHHMVIIGLIVINPLVKNILRVCVIS